jgi:hypothetical protein
MVLRHFALHLEHVRQRAVVGLGPAVLVGARVDQLHVDAHGVLGALHAAFEDVGDAEFLGDLLQVSRLGAVLDGAGPR